MNNWSPDSWQTKLAQQQVDYEDAERFQHVLDRIGRLPPLVTSWEIESLKADLGRASVGEAFLLQGGDCSESFDECDPDIITSKLKILLQMSLVLIYGCKKHVIRVGRFAGQYTKPRSSLTETRDDVTLPSYRGANINRSPFTESDRQPNPDLLLRGYERAAVTLNFIRALTEGGFADLHHPEYWDLGFVKHSPQAKEYRQIVDSIAESIMLMETITNNSIDQLNRAIFYTSHEGLHLPLEQAQTRTVPRRDGWYNLGTHLPWIGDRTRALEGAHVEYFRGIQNPLGLKVGPTCTPGELKELIGALNPDNEMGRLTLIHRFGTERIANSLPPLIQAAKQTGKSILWCCDPMHGNTSTTNEGIKTRSFDDILKELEQAFAIHLSEGSILGGVHFELTGENVTECIGGARGLSEKDLSTAYKSEVDPRLNYEQAMEMALRIARSMNGK